MSVIAIAEFTHAVPLYFKYCPEVRELTVTDVPLIFATVGDGYVPERSPLAVPLGARESERRESLPAATVFAAVPTFNVNDGVVDPLVTVK